MMDAWLSSSEKMLFLRRGGERWDEADVRIPATDIGQRRLAAEELADFPLQIAVAGHAPVMNLTDAVPMPKRSTPAFAAVITAG